MPAPTSQRVPTAADLLAERHLDASIALSPITATYLGRPEHDGGLDDYSPEGHQAKADLAKTTLRSLSSVPEGDAVDRVTVAAMSERLTSQLELHESGLSLSAMNVADSPLQEVRNVFDLMPTTTGEDLIRLGSRLRAVPAALHGWYKTLTVARRAGLIAPKRQVDACLRQARAFSGPSGFFDQLSKAHPALTADVAVAANAYLELSERLQSELYPLAPEQDSCGLDQYRTYSRDFLGTSIDPLETYHWAADELRSLTSEMQTVAREIGRATDPKQAMAELDADSRYTVDGVDSLVAWMKYRVDAALDGLARDHFDIPDCLLSIDCKVSPSSSGIIYYVRPSEDFDRPGAIYWSVPNGITHFSTWRDLTTVYHEGVPGHHLQVGGTAYRSGSLNAWRRLVCYSAGHQEGWALYAERLMDELGYLSEPAYRMGMLDGQSLRAARVILDIGIHCGLPAPEEVGGGPWDYAKAWHFLRQHANQQEPYLRYELDRYLGWPGQAASYKVGERVWRGLRSDWEASDTSSGSLRNFHRATLGLGGLGLDVLRQEVHRQIAPSGHE